MSYTELFGINDLILYRFSIFCILLLVVIGFLIYIIDIKKRNHNMLKQMADLREVFYRNITHEFRTPLTVILGLSADMQKEEGLPASVKDRAKIIGRQGKGLLTLINQLLDISKIKSEVGNPDWRNGNVVAYMMMIVETYRSYAKHRNIELQFFYNEDIVMDFIPDYMDKVMNNLLFNALKFTPDYGTVSISMWKNANQLYINVSDSGEGINADDLHRIFEPFYQADTDSQRIGTGIGLALVKQIIRVVGGEITVESQVGKGTTFHIIVPIHNDCTKGVDDNSLASSLFDLSNSPLPDKEGDEDSRKILVVEDNRDVAAYIGAQVSDKYAVYYAHNGREGLDKALDIMPDIIITDMMMPVMDGLDMCRRVRKSEVLSHIPVIMVTAKVTEEERISGFEAGADAYVSKPFSSDELIARVENLMERQTLMRQKYEASSASANIGKDSNEDNCGHTSEQRKNESKQIETRQESLNINTGNKSSQKQSDAFVVSLEELVKSTMGEGSVDVNTIADKMKMSTGQLRRKVFAITGVTPQCFIKGIQMETARRLLLEQPELSVNEISFRCGYPIQTHFSRAFKAQFGTSPLQWRKENMRA